MTGGSISGAGTKLPRRSSASGSDAGRDGAIAEAVDQFTGRTRADFPRKAVIGGSALVAALKAVAPAQERKTPKDVAILRVDRNLEYRLAAMYGEATRRGELREFQFQQGQLRSQERFEPGAARAAGGPDFAHVPLIPRRRVG